MTRDFKNRKALSPVVSAIILISVTVAVAIAVGTWMGSMSFSLMKTEELNIVNQVWASDISQVVALTVKNFGTTPVTISTVKVNKETANNVIFESGSATINAGESAIVTLAHSFVSGAKYEFLITTSTGNKFPCVGSALATSFSHIDWWEISCDHRKDITITNNLESTLSSGYSICLTMDTAILVSSGKMLSNRNDLRIVYWDGDSFADLDHDIIGMNTDSTQIWFKTQVDISLGATDDNYDMYYGYATAENPPCNRSSVYLLFDDFDRTDKLDITTEQAYVKTGGGTWSIESNTLKNVGASGDPNKFIITALGDFNVAVGMLVKIKVEPPFNGGNTSRMGLSCCMDDPSRGSGYCVLFHEDTNSLDFLNDYVHGEQREHMGGR